MIPKNVGGSWRWLAASVLLLSGCAAGLEGPAAATPAPAVVAPVGVGVTIPTPRPKVPVVSGLEATATPSLADIGVLPTVPPPELGGDPAFYYGGMRLTLDNVGQEVRLRKREWFLLALSADFDWQVVTSPEKLLSISTRYTPAAGEQGIFVARERGEAELRATGDPKCLKANPPCARPSVLFKIKVVIE